MSITVKKNIIGVTMASAFIMLGGLSACSKTQTSDSLIADAKQFQLKGDTKAAIIQLKNAVQKNPADAEARLALGAIYNETGDAASAEKEIRKALSLGASRDRALPVLAAVLLMQQQFQKVLDETQSEAGKKNPQIETLRGDAYLALGQPAKAKKAFELALQIQADHTDAMIGLARHALSQKDLKGAIGFSEQAVVKAPKNPEAWLFKGDLLKAQGKIDPALAAYDQVLLLKPDHRSAHIEKAYLEIQTGKFDAAKADIAAARKATPNSLIVMYAQALLEFTQETPAAARESLQTVLRAAPEHMPSVLLAGALEFKLGSMPQAEQHLKKYLEKNPENRYARKLLASTLLKLGQTTEALAVLAPALREPGQDAQLLAIAGEAHLQARDFGKATEYFEKASVLAPQAAALHTALALSKLGQGDNLRAISELEQSTKLDSKSSKAGILLVLTEMRLKHYDKALLAVKALEAAQPNDPMVQNLKGGVYLGKSDIANARASFEKAMLLQPSFFPAVANLAQLDVQGKKPDLAKQRLLAFLEKDKKNMEAMAALARLAAAQGHPDEATLWLERANSENPDAVAPALQLGAHYLRIGQKQKALTLARKFQVANSQSVELLDLLAQAQIANNDQNGALESYGKLTNLAPKSAPAQFRLASVQMLLKNEAAAADSLKKALFLEPDYLEAQLAQAGLAIRSGKLEPALAIARQIQHQRKTAPGGYALEGDLLIMQKKPALALAAYEQAYALGKTAPLMIKLHGAMKLNGKEKAADVRMAQFQKDHPADTLTGLYLAEAMIANKQYKPAIEKLQVIVKQEPKNIAALNNLAWSYHQEKDARALNTAEQAFLLAGESPAVIDTLGWILVEQGNTARGLPLLKKAVSLAPEAMDLRYHLAFALHKAGDKVNARKELDQVLASGKSFPQKEEASALLKQL